MTYSTFPRTFLPWSPHLFICVLWIKYGMMAVLLFLFLATTILVLGTTTTNAIRNHSESANLPPSWPRHNTLDISANRRLEASLATYLLRGEWHHFVITLTHAATYRNAIFCRTKRNWKQTFWSVYSNFNHRQNLIVFIDCYNNTIAQSIALQSSIKKET